MNKKVSVIVPVYNVEAYLPKCLDSLVNQTLEDIEILVINDGSPDQSQAVIDEYAKRYPDKIRAFMKENGGLSDARNFAIAHVTGEYIAFVDSDDYVDLDMYERMYAKAAGTDSDVVCCPMTYEYATKVQKCFFKEGYQFGKTAAEMPYVFMLANSFACNKLIRTSFWTSEGFAFPLKQYFEDSATMYGVLIKAKKIEGVNIPFYHYVKTREDAITKTFDHRIYDIFLSCDSILSQVQSQWDTSKELRENVVYICVRHIWARVKDLATSDNTELMKEYLTRAYAYMDEKLPNWKEIFNRLEQPDKKNKKAYFRKFLLQHKSAALFYYGIPKAKRNEFGKKYKMLTSIKSEISKKYRETKKWVRSNKTVENLASMNPDKLTIEEKKRLAIQSCGIELIESVQKILKESDICAFADFGTLLGLIREGKLLSHDLDVDIGVILKDPNDIYRVHIAMERNGFDLWRQYSNKDMVVEESYKRGDLKVDLNFYQIDEKTSKTWLFYTKPNYKYETKTQRHIVEMTYSPIKEMQTICIQGHDIVIPLNAEQLLVEKYGESWRTPDKGWIYWQSPAATPLDQIESFVLYAYAR